MNIRLIATGGTFDKVYDPLSGELVFDQTQLARIATRARLGDDVIVEQAMLIDSLDMDDTHRRRVAALCNQSPETRIVIVHGTDTMVRTAQVLAAEVTARTIVLTGAMVPYRVDDSDALFNLGYALGCARHLPAGIYVAMNGRTHAWDQVRKNRELGVFEPRPPSAAAQE